MNSLLSELCTIAPFKFTWIEPNFVILYLSLSFLLLSTSNESEQHLIQIISPMNGSVFLDDRTAIEYRVSQSAPAHWNVNLFINTRLALKSSDRAMKATVPGLQAGNHMVEAFMTDENDQQTSAKVNRTFVVSEVPYSDCTFCRRPYYSLLDQITAGSTVKSQ